MAAPVVADAGGIISNDQGNGWTRWALMAHISVRFGNTGEQIRSWRTTTLFAFTRGYWRIEWEP